MKLYPEDNEPVNILNVKRGIVSTLMVPVMEEDKNDKMVVILSFVNIPAVDSGRSLRIERLSKRETSLLLSQCGDKLTVLSAAGQSPR